MSPTSTQHQKHERYNHHTPHFIPETVKEVVRLSFRFLTYSACCQAACRSTLWQQSVSQPSLTGALHLGLVGEGHTLLNLLLQLGDHGVESSLLEGVHVANGQDLLHTVGAQQDLGGEEGHARHHLGLHKGALVDVGLAVQAQQGGLGHAGRSVGLQGGAQDSMGVNNANETQLTHWRVG